jgi:omega-amidase
VIRIALVQLRSVKTRAEPIEHVIKMIRNAGALEADIVSLPELWYPKIVHNFEQEFKHIIDLSREQNIIIISGAFLERINDDLFISSPVISRDGIIIGRQFKIHPFGSQRQAIKSGTTAEVFDGGCFKFGIGICYDVVFPEVSRALVRKGAEILFFPSKISKKGIPPWHMYVQVRALENRIPVAAPNVCDDNYGGKSMLASFDYDKKSDIAIPKRVVGSINNQNLQMDIDLDFVRKIREVRLKDLRSNLYGSL